MELALEEKNNIICDKYDIILYKLGKADQYSIRLSCYNNKYDLIKVLNYNLYKLLGELNLDLIERIDVSDENNEDTRDILFLFKSFGRELGLLKKYMFISTRREEANNTIIFRSVDKENTVFNGSKKYEKITCYKSELIFKIINKHKIDIVYNFHIDLHEDLPKYMENLIGILMKKVLFRLKIFIEKME
jgi:hypothetical protein